MTMELLFNLHVLGLQHADPLFLVALIDFFIHGFFLHDLLGDVERLARTFPVEHGSTVGRLQASIETAVLSP